jgi:hypothetical protein
LGKTKKQRFGDANLLNNEFIDLRCSGQVVPYKPANAVRLVRRARQLQNGRKEARHLGAGVNNITSGALDIVI